MITFFRNRSDGTTSLADQRIDRRKREKQREKEETKDDNYEEYLTKSRCSLKMSGTEASP